MKSIYFLVILLLLITGCESPTQVEPNSVDQENVTEPESKPEEKPSAAAQPLQAPTSEEFTLSEQGIGEAKIGMTLGELKKKLGDGATFETLPSFMTDFDAIAVKKGSETLFYVLYFNFDPLEDGDEIQILLTDNPQFRTTDGVGPGTPIQQAESVYGDATLSYTTDYESKEFVKFAQTAGKKMTFKTNGNVGEKGFVGVYPQSSGGEYYETKDFKDSAKIGEVMVEGQLH